MTRRFTTRVTCPECGQSGIVTWEETENPADDEMTPQSAPAGFRIAGNDVVCIPRGVVAVAVSD